MKCSRCAQDSPLDADFCPECGAKLALVCGSCGTANAPTHKFCKKCGHPLGAELGQGHSSARFTSPDSYTPKHLAERIINSKAALEGERKQVTVLFADLKSSMELLADRDPEEARKILDPVLEHMIEAVHRFEGTVNQVMGDGIMALFGAPLAHEDHAARACFAALRMQETIGRYADGVRRSYGINVQIRVGLNSGEVVVRAIGSDLRMDYTAVGQTTHLAARMEQLARVGTILMTEATLALVEGYVEVKALGPVPVKGVAEPIEAFEAIGAGTARTRFQAAARRGLTRFVGRDAEMEQLHRVLQRAADGHGQVAAIVGEAGVGKSRLVYELTHSHRVQGWLVLESASVSYGKATTYLPVIDLLKGYFKIQDRDDLRTIREKVTGKVLTLDEGLKPLFPALLALLDAGADDPVWQAMDPLQRRRATLDAVRRLILREAREQPLLVIFEDLHWIDGETQAFLDHLVESLGSARLLLVVNYRPEYQHAWGGKTFYSQMRLDALPAESATELLDALLGDDPSLAALKEMLVKRGNPFFLEETIRALVETKVLTGERGRYHATQEIRAIQVPATVQAILAARIDRLAAEDKRLLQVASVIGKEVPLAVLQAIADLPEDALNRGLAQLQTSEFLYETGLFPDLAYSFKHALTHEVTYGGLLQERRRHLHARLVEVIETLHSSRLDEQAELLAHHAQRGEAWEKAVRYLHQASRRAADRSVDDARRWFDETLSVLARLPETQFTLEKAYDVRIGLSTVLNGKGEVRESVVRLREAEAVVGRLNDSHRQARLHIFFCTAQTLLDELDESLAHGLRALEIATEVDAADLCAAAAMRVSQAHYFRNDFNQAVDFATRSASMYRGGLSDFGFNGPLLFSRWILMLSFGQLGRFNEAGRFQSEALELSASTRNELLVGQIYSGAGTLQLILGNWDKARLLFERALVIHRRAGYTLNIVRSVVPSSLVLAHLGLMREARSALEEGEKLLEQQITAGIVGHRGWDYHLLGRTSLAMDQIDEASRFAARAMECAAQPGFVGHARHLMGDIALRRSRLDVEAAGNYYHEALDIAKRLGMRPLIAHSQFGLGRVHGRTGKREQAREHLSSATTMYRDMGMTYWLEKAEAEMRKLQ